MAKDELEVHVKRIHGAVEKGGSISRVKAFRDPSGKIIAYGPQEHYTREPRNYKKHPQTANEKAHQALWVIVCAQAKQELADPDKRAVWEQRFTEQLNHATADTPEELVAGARKIYRRLDAFVRAVLHRQLRAQQ